MRTIRTLVVAAMVIASCHNANAITVLVDAAWVHAGFGSAGDRCIDNVLLDLEPGDTLGMITPTPGESAELRQRLGFTLHRRPSIRAAELLAARRLLDQVLATVDPTEWPSLAQVLEHVAASPGPDQRRERRYVVIGALTAVDPPAIGLDLQRLLRARRITVVDLAHSDAKRRDSRLKAWRRFFTAAGAAQVHILAVAAPSEAQASQPRIQAIDCSRRRLQILDHQL